MKIVKQGISLQSVLNISSVYMTHTVIYIPTGKNEKKHKFNLCNKFHTQESPKQALDLGLVIQRVYMVIEFYQKALLKQDIDSNRKLRTKAKNNFKNLFKLMNISLAKSMGNIRKYWDIKLVTNKKKKKWFNI